MKHLILVGACYLDTILTVPQFPEEDSKLRATNIQVRRGGNCPNSLEVLVQLLAAGPHHPPQQQSHRQLPIKLHLVTCLPDRGAAATGKILSSFDDDSSQNPIDFSHCLYRAGHAEPASSYIMRSSATGSRTIVNFNDLPEMTADEFKDVADEFSAGEEHGNGNGDGGGCWWHFEGRIPETTLRCMRYLRRVTPGCTISVEVEKPNREGLVELAAEADVVFYSRSWAESRGYATPEACLRAEAASSKASLMLCTWGEQGAGALTPASGEYIHHAATPSGETVPVVDVLCWCKVEEACKQTAEKSGPLRRHRSFAAVSPLGSGRHVVFPCTIGAGDTFIAGILYALHADARDFGAKLEFGVQLATKKVQREGFAGLLP